MSQETPPLSKQETRQLLQAKFDALEQVLNNPILKEYISENQESYDSGISTILEMTPNSIGEFITRERLIGAASESQKRSRYFIDLKSSLEQELTQ